MIFLWISPTVLRQGTRSENRATCVSDRRLNLRRQLVDRLAYGLVDVIHLSSIHPPVKGSADVGTGQSELEIIRLVEHRILYTHQSVIHQREGVVNTP